MKTLLSRTLCFLLLSVTPVSAGTVWEARFKSPGLKSNGPNLKLSLQDSRLRLDLKAYPVDGTVLFDRSTGVLTVVDHYAKSYEEFGAAKRFFMGKTLQVGLGVYESRLDKAPREQREAWDRLRSAVRAVFAASFQATPQTIKVGGKNGAKYSSNPDKLQTLNLVMAPADSVGLGSGEWETWKAFCELLRDSLGGGLAYFGADPDKLAAWPGVPGFPLEGEWIEGTQKKFEVRVESVKPKNLSDSTFDPPPGYQDTSLMDML